MTEFKSLVLSEYLVETESGKKERDKFNESTIVRRLSLIEE